MPQCFQHQGHVSFAGCVGSVGGRMPDVNNCADGLELSVCQEPCFAKGIQLLFEPLTCCRTQQIVGNHINHRSNAHGGQRPKGQVTRDVHLAQKRLRMRRQSVETRGLVEPWYLGCLR